MYIGFICLALLVVSQACNAQVGVETVVNVAQTLVKLFAHDEEKIKDLTTAEELVRGLTFDQFNEKISCKVVKGIFLKDFATVIENLAARFSIPDDLKNSLLEGLISDENIEVIKEFKFTKGEGGDFTFGRIATIRHGQKIDMAYSIYFLDFKICPKVVEHSREKKFLWFAVEKKEVWHVTVERTLSNKEKDDFEMYALKRAIQGFKDQYAGMIEEQYCNTKDKECN